MQVMMTEMKKKKIYKYILVRQNEARGNQTQTHHRYLVIKIVTQYNRSDQYVTHLKHTYTHIKFSIYSPAMCYK